MHPLENMCKKFLCEAEKLSFFGLFSTPSDISATIKMQEKGQMIVYQSFAPF